jgi:glutamate synthase domain-containing protein 2
MMSNFLIDVLMVLAGLFVFVVGAGAIFVIVLFVIDVTQTSHAIRRNYPVIGRFRYWFEHLGAFFRQYFFAMDREEMPFNREQRSYVYRAAKDEDTTVAFGSTRDLRPPGTIIFVNCPFPTLERDASEVSAVTIGPDCANPFTTTSLFNASAMSFGAISKVAVQALSRGTADAGAWLNTGEGGLAPYHLEGGADVVFQIGTAKYGVRDADGNLSDKKLAEIAAIDQVRMFEIKLSQGAKPGKGGILPGGKVTAEIAGIRGIPEGEDSISPNRHLEVDTPDQLLDLVARVRGATGKPTGFKAVIGAYGWLDDLFARIHARGLESAPDFITIDSGDGGTGAAPMSLMDNVGLPLQESLPVVADRLVAWNLKPRIKLIASGKLINPAEAAWAIATGADFVVSARGFMFALGCIQAMQCNKNTCPTGVTTHDPALQRGLVPDEKATRVAHYVRNMVHEICVIAHSCGVAEPRLLRRFHVRLVGQNGRSRALNDIFPDQTPGAALSDGPKMSEIPSPIQVADV